MLEPKGTTVSSDFARAHVLVGGTPVLESEAWLMWADQFRSEMPNKIRRTMAEEQARLEVEDPDRAKRIRERLKEVMQLLRPRRFRRKPQGTIRATAELTGPGVIGSMPDQPSSPKESRLRSTPGPRSRGIGALLTDLDEQNGEPATNTGSVFNLDPKWVSEEESDGFSIVNGNSDGLRDRAAALAGTDGRTANILLLNREFRGYQAILAAVNEWANPEGDDDKAAKIESITQEWVEQKMIEAVQGLRQLENGKTWITEHYDEAMSPVALTVAFMADRYHTLTEVKRAVGSLRQNRRLAASAQT